MTSSSYDPSSPANSQNVFLEAFRRHAAGVSIVTLNQPDGSPTGFTATSVASLSADPPLVTLNMSTTSSSWPAVQQADHLLVHILGQANLGLAKKFADMKEARFLGVNHTEGPEGLPLLPGVSAYLVGKIIGRHEHANAATVVVEVVGGGLGQEGPGLGYQGRQYAVATPLDN
jgi:flavin reductase (DIM6/NTAB) family NADH-FMN oxidoreductase RutF